MRCNSLIVVVAAFAAVATASRKEKSLLAWLKSSKPSKSSNSVHKASAVENSKHSLETLPEDSLRSVFAFSQPEIFPTLRQLSKDIGKQALAASQTPFYVGSLNAENFVQSVAARLTQWGA